MKNAELKVFLGYFLTSLAYYSSLLYLAIYLKTLFHLSPTAIAFVIAMGSISSCLSGILIGQHIDRYNKKIILLLSLFFSMLSFFLVSFAKVAFLFLLANALIGLFRGIIDTTFKTYLASEFSNKISAFGYRALTINLSAALGPLLGYPFAEKVNIHLFLGCAAAQAIACGVLWIAMPNCRVVKSDDQDNFKLLSHFLWSNKAFIFLLITIILSVACYAQIDSTLPIYLTEKLARGLKIYFILLLTNAIGAILIQPFASYFIRKTGWVISIQMGLGFFAIFFILFALSQNLVILLIAILFFTFGELLVFQAGYLGIDQLSPFESKGFYYGMSNLDSMGLFIGPLVGCSLYEQAGFSLAFILSCLLLIFPAYLLISGRSVIAGELKD